jgi:hypothetical protein
MSNPDTQPKADWRKMSRAEAATTIDSVLSQITCTREQHAILSHALALLVGPPQELPDVAA